MAQFSNFISLEDAETRLIQATAINLAGLTVRQDFGPTIGDYRRKNTVMWQLIKKQPANSPKIQEIRRTARPNVGFVDRDNLAGTTQNPVGTLNQDLTDPGQDVKAIAGMIDVSHFSRSMLDQQGRPWGDQVSADTDDLITSCFRLLERSLIVGNATANPLEFNGLTRLLPTTGHTFTADITGATPDRIYDKLDEICMRAATDVDILRKIDAIYCSGAGARALVKEVKELQLYQNLQEITPGVQVPGILTAYGMIPIVTSPYIGDLDGGAGNDTLNFWLVDRQTLSWHGVYPFGGKSSLEPQIFDVSNIINGIPMLEKRICLVYGALYALNRGEGIYKLEVTAPPGTTFNNG